MNTRIIHILNIFPNPRAPAIATQPVRIAGKSGLFARLLAEPNAGYQASASYSIAGGSAHVTDSAIIESHGETTPPGFRMGKAYPIVALRRRLEKLTYPPSLEHFCIFAMALETAVPLEKRGILQHLSWKKPAPRTYIYLDVIPPKGFQWPMASKGLDWEPLAPQALLWSLTLQLQTATPLAGELAAAFRDGTAGRELSSWLQEGTADGVCEHFRHARPLIYHGLVVPALRANHPFLLVNVDEPDLKRPYTA